MRLRTGKKEAGKTGCGEAEDTVGLTPVKDGSDVLPSFFPPNFSDFHVLRLYLWRAVLYSRMSITVAGILHANLYYYFDYNCQRNNFS